MNFFLLCSFMDRLGLTIRLSNFSIDFFLPLLSQELSPFCSKELFTASLWHLQIARATTFAFWGHYLVPKGDLNTNARVPRSAWKFLQSRAHCGDWTAARRVMWKGLLGWKIFTVEYFWKYRSGTWIVVKEVEVWKWTGRVGRRILGSGSIVPETVKADWKRKWWQSPGHLALLLPTWPCRYL